MRQSKTLLTIDERGSEIATTSVFDCQWSPVGRLMAIEKSVSNYNILFRILTFAKPSCDNVLQPSPLRGSGCNTLSHWGLANVNIRKKMFYPLIIRGPSYFSVCALFHHF